MYDENISTNRGGSPSRLIRPSKPFHFHTAINHDKVVWEVDKLDMDYADIFAYDPGVRVAVLIQDGIIIAADLNRSFSKQTTPFVRLGFHRRFRTVDAAIAGTVLTPFALAAPSTADWAGVRNLVRSHREVQANVAATPRRTFALPAPSPWAGVRILVRSHREV